MVDRLLTTKEAAEMLGIHLVTLYGYISDGRLKALKLPGSGDSKRRHWRIKESDLEAFINSNGEGARES